MPIARITSAVLFCTLTATLSHRSACQNTPGAIKFEIVSVRVLSSKESGDRSPDNLGANVAVRLRLVGSGQGFYLYTAKGTLYPIGYLVKIVNGKTIWPDQSPGLEKAAGSLPGDWLLLTGWNRPLVEWEQLDTTRFEGEKHAFTVFVKLNEKDKPVEIVSDPYVVPAGTTLIK